MLPAPLPPHPLKDNIANVPLELVGSHPTSTHYRLLIGDSSQTRDRIDIGSVVTSLFLMEIDPGGTNFPHHHPREEEIYLVLDGHGDQVAGSGVDGIAGRFPAGPGDAYYYRANATVGYYSARQCEVAHPLHPVLAAGTAAGVHAEIDVLFEGPIMLLAKRLGILGLAAALIGGCAGRRAAPWTRGFVVGTYEPAFHYGGRAGFARTGEVEPGSDCAHGSTVHFSNPEHVKEALRRQRWRDPADIDKIGAPPGLEQVPGPATTRFSIWDRALSYRGWKKGIETYVNPFAAEDTGQPEVTGRISDGLDLDNNPATGFTSPDGRRGVDNNLYKRLGLRRALARQWQRHAGPARQRQDAGRHVHDCGPRLWHRKSDE